MSILHDIAKYGKIGDAGDLIEWLNSDQSNDFYADYHQQNYKHVHEPNPRGINFDVVVKANKELRKPLELSDFVRGPEPDLNDHKYDQLLRTTTFGVGADPIYIADFEAWKNWTPLFDGWECAEYHGVYEVTKGDFIIDYFVKKDKWWSSGFSLSEPTTPTREDFIRLCKSHNIDLLNKES